MSKCMRAVHHARDPTPIRDTTPLKLYRCDSALMPVQTPPHEHSNTDSAQWIMPGEKLVEFATFSGMFHACLLCGYRNGVEFLKGSACHKVPAIRSVRFCQFPCF